MCFWKNFLIRKILTTNKPVRTNHFFTTGAQSLCYLKLPKMCVVLFMWYGADGHSLDLGSKSAPDFYNAITLLIYNETKCVYQIQMSRLK